MTALLYQGTSEVDMGPQNSQHGVHNAISSDRKMTQAMQSVPFARRLTNLNQTAMYYKEPVAVESNQ